MKRSCLLFLLLGFFCAPLARSADALVVAPTRADELRAAFLDTKDSRVFVAAHRADWRGFPENSLPAIASAIGLGVDIVEIDVARTKDGWFIVIHDETLERTTTGKGRVRDHTLAEIQRMRLRNGCGIPTQERVPTLEDALLAAKGRVLLNLDKSYGWLREFFPILERTGTTRQVIIKTYNLPAELVWKENADLLPQVLFMPIVNFKLPGSAEIAHGYHRLSSPLGMEIAFPRWQPEVEASFAACVAHGTRIWANTMWTGLSGDLCDDFALADPEANYGWLLARGVTVVQTDRPAYLLSYLQKKSLHP